MTVIAHMAQGAADRTRWQCNRQRSSCCFKVSKSSSFVFGYGHSIHTHTSVWTAWSWVMSMHLVSHDTAQDVTLCPGVWVWLLCRYMIWLSAEQSHSHAWTDCHIFGKVMTDKMHWHCPKPYCPCRQVSVTTMPIVKNKAATFAHHLEQCLLRCQHLGLDSPCQHMSQKTLRSHNHRGAWLIQNKVKKRRRNNHKHKNKYK